MTAEGRETDRENETDSDLTDGVSEEERETDR